MSRYADVVYDDDNYNCLHFAIDVYEEITGVNFAVFVDELLTGRANRRINPDKLKAFTQIAMPMSPCLAITQGAEPHAGIYVDGRIVHLTREGILSQAPHIVVGWHGEIRYYVI